MEEASPSSSNAVPDRRKLFIGGMPRTVTQQTLRTYFQKYGEVVSTYIPMENGCRSRGFGFVLFADPAMAQLALDDGEHVIQERKVDVKRAVPQTESRSPRHKKPGDQNCTNTSCEARKKIFVGGLPSALSVDDFRSYFEQFGSVIDAVIVRETVTYKSRGFGFITYESEESVKAVMQQSDHQDGRHMHLICGGHVEVKIANPKQNNRHNQHSGAVDSQYPLQYQSENYPDYYYMHPSYSAYPYGANYYGGYMDMNEYHIPYVDMSFPWHLQPFQLMPYPNHMYHFQGNQFPIVEPIEFVRHDDGTPAGDGH